MKPTWDAETSWVVALKARSGIWALHVSRRQGGLEGFRWHVTLRYPAEGSPRQSFDLTATGVQATPEAARSAAERAVELFEEFPP